MSQSARFTVIALSLPIVIQNTMTKYPLSVSLYYKPKQEALHYQLLYMHQTG